MHEANHPIQEALPPSMPPLTLPVIDTGAVPEVINEFDPDVVHEDGSWKEKTIKVAGGVVVSAAAVTYAFELSWLNEVWRVNAGTTELIQGGSAADVGLVVTKITAGIEVASGSLIALGLNMKSDTVDKLKGWLKARRDEALEDSEEELPKDKSRLGSLATDAALALGAGAGIVVVKDHYMRDEPSLTKDMGSMAKGAAVVVPVSGLTGYLVGGGLNSTEGTALEKPAELFVDYALDSRFMFLALTAGYAFKYRKQIPAASKYFVQQLADAPRKLSSMLRRKPAVTES